MSPGGDVELFVYRDAERGKKTRIDSGEEQGDKGRREKIETEKEKKKRSASVCSCGGQLRGSSSPLGPSLAPARSLRGSLGS